MYKRVLLVLLAALPLYAKSLYWRSVDVNARLDRDGDLHVTERQQIVFDGDWNGGERDFDVRPGQRVAVTRIARVDGNRKIPLVEGDLDAVDHWDHVKRDVVRWRSRAKDDPPFADRELTYVIEYVYSEILRAENGSFVLAHDFGMPKRGGVIEKFQLTLDFDPVWNVQRVTDLRMPLEPNQSVVVTQALAYSGGGWPAGVTKPLPWWTGVAAVALLVIGAASLILAFVRGEREVGRFAPLPAQFDPELLQLLPEVAGTAWDGVVGPPEVAAILARMAQEGKITTGVYSDVLHLKLNVPLHELRSYEYSLASKLFITNETNTDKVREHYKGSGFNPAEEIRVSVESAVGQAIPGWKRKERRFNPWLHVATIPLAIVFIVLAVLRSTAPGMMLLAVFPGGVFALLACILGSTKSRSVADHGRALVMPAMLMGLPMLGFAVTALTSAGARVTPALPFALAAWLLALLHLLLNLMKIRDPREVIAHRRRIAGAREFFAEQLSLPEPALRDEWFPYVVAFGLGKQADRWFRAFGATSAGASSWSSASSSSSSTSASSSGSGWTGGGGAFGGAGATGSWAVAAGAIASGVAAPGSSGGGGGDGGSASSGGGGGGGW